jgi:phosphatidylglycerol:prolipoprotein diacylglycerol transferase
MLNFPVIEPVLFTLGPLKIHWYGIMYLVAFGSAWWLAKYRAHRVGFSHEQVADLIFWSALGVVVGGRFGYVLFYRTADWLADPILLLRIWQGGMSFHGGLIGVIIAVLLFARKQQVPFYQVMDFVAPLVPLGLGAGRLGNFIGGELWGRATDLPWGMVFPHVDQLARHPSQIYQLFLEGIVLFILIWLYSARPRRPLAVSGLFLLAYGSLRCLVELVRQPDAHMGEEGFIALGWLTQGQILSLPMIILGLYLLWQSQPETKTGR